MPNQVQNISFMSPEGAQAAEIDRRRLLAEALQNQSMQQTPTETVGGWAVKKGPLEGINKILQAFLGAKGIEKADEETKALATQQQDRRGADMSMLVNALGGRQAQPAGISEDASGNVTPTDPVAAQSPAQALQQAMLMIKDPQIQQTALGAFMSQQPKKPEPFTLKPGEVRYGPDGKPQVSAPAIEEKPAPFTLAPGAVRYDAKGNVLAEAKDKPEPQAKVPAGYRMKPDGTMEAIPGGPADLKMQGAFNQDTAALSGATSSFDRLASAANELMRHPGLGGITGKMSMFPNVPGSDAANAQAKLNTLKSQVGFGVLQDMRNNSRTGGALGSVSDAEGKRLEANLAALENAQSEDQMRESLQKILDYTAGAKVRLQQAFNMRHGAKADGQKADEPPVPAPGAKPKVVKFSDL